MGTLYNNQYLWIWANLILSQLYVRFLSIDSFHAPLSNKWVLFKNVHLMLGNPVRSYIPPSETKVLITNLSILIKFKFTSSFDQFKIKVSFPTISVAKLEFQTNKIIQMA